LILKSDIWSKVHAGTALIAKICRNARISAALSIKSESFWPAASHAPADIRFINAMKNKHKLISEETELGFRTSFPGTALDTGDK
jgi:hypothetical protein